MSSETTRGKQYSQTTRTLYLAFELGNAEWRLAFTIGLGQKPRERTLVAGDVETLKTEITRAKERFGLPVTARVVSCYEAGRDGFWLHRFLVQQGVESLVVDSASIEVKRRGRRVKTDRLDVRRLMTRGLDPEGVSLASRSQLRDEALGALRRHG